MSGSRSVTLPATATPDRRAQTNQQILNATRDLLAGGEPLARLSIQRIVEAAGVSRATFYLHFRTKRDLMSALAQQETREWSAIAMPFLANLSANRLALEQAVMQAVQTWRVHSAVLSGVIELAEYDEDTRSAWNDTIGTIAQTIAAGIRLRRPELTRQQADQLGLLIAWSGERLFHQQAREPSSDDDQLLVWSLVEMIWSVMKGRRRPTGKKTRKR